MVMIKQKPVLDTQRMRKEYKPILLKKVMKPQRKRTREEERKYKTARKTMNNKPISTYLSVITLNVNGLNSQIRVG